MVEISLGGDGSGDDDGSLDPRGRILIVDDDEASRRLLIHILKSVGYECDEAAEVVGARSKLEETAFDVVLTDMTMPGSSGIDLIEYVSAVHPAVATIMVSGRDDPDLAESALRIGAYGYIVKPFRANDIIINVSNALFRRALEIQNRRHRDNLTDMVRERTAELWNAIQELERTQQELRTSRRETIERLAIAAELRDDQTASHIRRMSRYCELLARKTGADEERCESIKLAGAMHDVGKIGIPDNILLKPRALTPGEYQLMKQHAELGYQILSGSDSETLDIAATIALTHHERMDGGGYPHGLFGDEIPVEGRIAGIADVFDAVTTDRVYRKAYSLGEGIEIMKEGRGRSFDPELLDVFLDSMVEVLEVKAAAEAA
jgi:putative two-component system response regulator